MTDRPIAPGDTIPIEFTVTDVAGEWLTVRRGSVSFAFRVPSEPSEPDPVLALRSHPIPLDSDPDPEPSTCFWCCCYRPCGCDE